LLTCVRFAAFWLLAFLLAPPVLPQTTSGHAKEESLYSQGLFASIVGMEKAWGRFGEIDYRHMSVEKYEGITDDLPEESGGYHVEYLDTQQLIEKCKQLKKSFAVLRIWPMKAAGDKLTIQTTVYWVEYKKSRLRLALSDWSDVEFRFDREQQRFVVSKVTRGGI
jgi:hypothetical protein